MSKIIVIVGCTATGKTKLSITLAKKYNAVIINADRMQMYEYANIATAKIKEEEKENITHYFLDTISLNEEYTIFDYQREGRKLLDELINENKNIIIVGGSGLYIKALLYDYELIETKKEIIDLNSYSNSELKTMADQISKNEIHVNNRKRLERFIKYYKETGNVLEKKDNSKTPLYNFDIVGLIAPREKMYNRINLRVEEMFNDGILDEAKSLKDYKFFNTIIGYKEIGEYFKSLITLEDCKELIKQNSRKYAKRQLTFFNHQFNDIVWFNTDYNNFDNTINEVIKYLENKNN